MSKELKLELFNIYDVVVFEDENRITQDCVCCILKDKDEDADVVGVIGCNNNNITIYKNGGYKVWEKDGKDLPYYSTNKKIIHLYTLKNDNRFYEVYPTDDYGVADNANPSEALECVDYIEKKLAGLRYECERTKNHRCDDLFIQEHIFTTIKQELLKAQEQERENKELKKFKELYQAEIEVSDDKETNEFYDRLKENEIKAKAFDEIKDIVDMILAYGDYEIINDKICQVINKTSEAIKCDDKESN